MPVNFTGLQDIYLQDRKQVCANVVFQTYIWMSRLLWQIQMKKEEQRWQQAECEMASFPFFLSEKTLKIFDHFLWIIIWVEFSKNQLKINMNPYLTFLT